MTARLTIIDESQRVIAAVRKETYRNLGHAAASIRKAAMALIRRSPRASEAGKAPHTRKGLLRRAYRYAIERRGSEEEVAFVGPLHSVVGPAAVPHEFGGVYKGARFPARPAVGPALEANLDRFADQWSGSLGPG